MGPSITIILVCQEIPREEEGYMSNQRNIRSKGDVNFCDISSQNAFHSAPNAGDIKAIPQNSTRRLGGAQG